MHTLLLILAVCAAVVWIGIMIGFGVGVGERLAQFISRSVRRRH